LEEILPEDKASVVRDENLIIAPMWCDDEVMKLLMAEFDAFASLSEKHMIQLNLAAQLIKTAIEKEFLQLQISKLERDLAEIAMPDPERFMHNNQLIEWVVEREIERTQRHGASFAVLAIALDNLAHLMTQFKPQVIENIITGFSEVMDYIIRKCDLLTRRGGERFLCISMEQNQAGAMVLAEKLRHRVKETPIEIDGQKIQSTISIGIAVWPGEGRITASELIRRAEEALKDAQSKGNRVRIWRPSKHQ
jgi:diguanylate cyclase (GGDEF)-like protein